MFEGNKKKLENKNLMLYWKMKLNVHNRIYIYIWKAGVVIFVFSQVRYNNSFISEQKNPLMENKYVPKISVVC